MQIKTDFLCVFSIEYQSDGSTRPFQIHFRRPRLQQIFTELIEQLPEWIAPQAAWDLFPISGVDDDHFLVAGQIPIGSGPVVDVMAHASYLILGACTLGSRIDEKVNEYQQSKEPVHAAVLSEMGTWLIDQTFLQLNAFMQQVYCNQNQFLSIHLCPGSTGWQLEDQQIIFKLLDLSQIGLRLNDQCMMSPLKSITFGIGLSNTPFQHNVQEKCELCNRSATCRYRKIPHDPRQPKKQFFM